jgi:hypothetical protein
MKTIIKTAKVAITVLIGFMGISTTSFATLLLCSCPVSSLPFRQEQLLLDKRIKREVAGAVCHGSDCKILPQRNDP